MAFNRIQITTILSSTLVVFFSSCSTNNFPSHAVDMASLMIQPEFSVSQNSSKRSQENEPPTRSKDVIKPEDRVRFQQIMQSAKTDQLTKQPIGEIMSAIAQQFLGTPYQANLLDGTEQERLVLSLTQFDCFIFVETMLALARGIKLEDYNFSSFRERMIEQRYREGEINGYCSRLHYFSEWIQNNQEQGTIKDITFQLGGTSLDKKLNFMSEHRQLYPRLIQSDQNYQCIQKMEENLEEMRIYYLPTDQIRSIYHLLQPGDIISIATEITGLDVSHTGLITQSSKQQASLIHASPAGEVVIAPELVKYVKNVPSAKGILVARPVTNL
jgi:cell wall-associated NlpC family hydrolase